MADSRRPRSSGGSDRRAAGGRHSPGGDSGGSSSQIGSDSAKGSSRTGRTTSGGTADGAASVAGVQASRKPKNALNYPRAGRGRVGRWIPSWRLLVLLVLLAVIAGLAVLAYAYVRIDVPEEPTDVAVAESSEVVYADGEAMGTFGEIDREIVAADEIPEVTKSAAVASEDETFYENRGISPKGLLRAFLNNLSGGDRQGGSTITQQYVENYYVGAGSGQTYLGKFREIIMALKVDEEVSKDEILSNYLNTIYFGRSAYGIEAGAQAYFGKSASELTLSESALLVGIIPSPSAWDPAEDPDQAEQRWQRTLDNMVELGMISQEEADQQTFPETIPDEPEESENALGGTTGYLMQHVRNEVVDEGILTEEELETGGYTITTTIDPTVQQAHEDAMAAMPDRVPEAKTGSVSIDPETGAIVAMYGGPDYLERQVNAAAQDILQAGSTAKIFTLVGALQDGYTLDSTLPGNSPQNWDWYGAPVTNYDNTDYGRLPLRQATSDSVNTAYVYLNHEMGAEKTAETAVAMGLDEETAGLDGNVSNVLGTFSPTILDMAGAVSTLASEGVRHAPHMVATIENSQEGVVHEAETSGEQVIGEDVAINANVALQDVVESGTASYVGANMDRPVAGKTGTSDSFRSAWFIGYTPQLVTSVATFETGAGGETQPLTPYGEFDNVTGTAMTRPFVDIMTQALEGEEVVDFPSAVERGQGKDTGVSPEPEPTAPQSAPPATQGPSPEQPPGDDESPGDQRSPGGQEPPDEEDGSGAGAIDGATSAARPRTP